MTRASCALLIAMALMACDTRDSGAAAPVAQDTAGPDERFTLGDASFDIRAVQQWLLPIPLREISGLARTPDGRLFAHNDELGLIYQLDPDAGRIVKRFGFGRPVVAGDFEGIAFAAGEFWLVTSDGELLRGSEAVDDGAVPFERIATGLGERCEVEGLATATDGASLFLLCKQAREDALDKRISVFRFLIATGRLLPEPISVRQKDVRDRADSKGAIKPSGIDVHPDSGHLIIVAADEKLLIEITEAGALVDAVKLPLKDHHPQAEGIALLPDGRMLISDEGNHERGRLTVYAPAR